MFRGTSFHPGSHVIRLTFQVLLLTLLFVSSLFAQWEPDRRLTFNDSASSTTPGNNARCVAASGDTVHVAFYDSRDGNLEIYYKRSTDAGLNWGADMRLTNAPGSSVTPSISVSGIGVHVVWEDERDDPVYGEIYYKRSTDGGLSWGADQRLTYAAGASWWPAVAASGSMIHAVWADQRDGNWEIYCKRSTNGGAAWQADARLTYDPSNSVLPSIAVSDSVVYVTWSDSRVAYGEIFYRRSTDSGLTWSAETQLTNDPIHGSGASSISTSGSTVHVAWHRNMGGGIYDVFYIRSTDGGISWSSEINLTNNVGELIRFPNIFGSDANVHVVWIESAGGYYEIFYRRSMNGGTSWEPETRLTYDPAYLRSVQSAFGAVSGSMAHVVWTDSRDGNQEIYYKRNPTGNSGVEENTAGGNQRLEVRLQATPNPFTSFTSISDHERERFALYDISGRLVGSYQGDRIGEGLKAGIYFLRSEGVAEGTLRVVKLR